MYLIIFVFVLTIVMLFVEFQIKTYCLVRNRCAPSRFLTVGILIVEIMTVGILNGSPHLYLDKKMYPSTTLPVDEHRNDDDYITLSSRVTLVPPTAPASRGCISKTVRNRFSEVVLMKPISAFGCRPYNTGLSAGRTSSM